METVGEALVWGENQLGLPHHSSYVNEAHEILCWILKIKPTDLFLRIQNRLTARDKIRFFDMMNRRVRQEPVAYITGEKNFFGRDFIVDPSVLIPRPETELLVDQALTHVRKRGIEAPRVLEIGTGSGCIAVTLAHEMPRAHIVAIDISEEALRVASRNAARFKTESNVTFLHSDLYGKLGPEWEGDFDMIISNPPYVSTEVYHTLEAEVRREPRLALDGGPDGLGLIRPLVQHAKRYLSPSGILLLEMGYDQALSVRRILEENHFFQIEIIKDYAQHDRIAKGEMNGPV